MKAAPTPVFEQPTQMDKEEASLFVNPATDISSPETVLLDQKFFATDKEASKKPPSEQEGSKILKKGGPRTVFIQQDKLHPSSDLVLANRNVSDSEQESPETKRSRHNSEDPSVRSDWPLTAGEETTDSVSMDARRLSLLRKSSSEGNIHKITLSNITQKSPRGRGSQSRHVIRRVASTTVSQNEPASTCSKTFTHATSSPSISPPATVKRFDLSKSGRMSPPTSPSRAQGGWTAESAAIVWQRMLKILGDVNEIHDPDIHSNAMSCLEETWKALVSVS